jgi:streptogrisin C
LRPPTRREGTIWLAGAIAAVTGLAVASPSFISAADSPSGSGSSTSRTGDTLVLAALERDLSISRGDASARLARQQWAGNTERMLRTVLGDDFAGAWLGADGREFNVGVTTRAAAAKVRAAGATPRMADYSSAALSTFKSELDGSTAQAGDGIGGWYVDAKTNRLTVVAKRAAVDDAKSLAAANGVPARALRVVVSEDTPKPLFDLRGGDPYFIDQQFRCSIGFSVEGGFVTAGHCGAVGATTTGFNQEAQGTVRVSTFPGNGDFGFVETNADWTPRPVVNDFNGGEAPVAGSDEAPIGAAICRSGSTTGTRCGVIQAKNVTVNYPEGAVTGLTQTDVCAEGGDSGGSWLSGDQAQGVTSGGTGDCTVGGTTFFQPVNEILAAANATLVTEEPGGAAPPATEPPATEPPATEPPAEEEPPATACESLEFALNGTLENRRERDAQPDPTGFFAANAGTHTACLSGAADSDLELRLQEFDGERWDTVAEAEDADEGEVEQLTFEGAAGFFRYLVTSDEGSGNYQLAVAVP